MSISNWRQVWLLKCSNMSQTNSQNMLRSLFTLFTIGGEKWKLNELCGSTNMMLALLYVFIMHYLFKYLGSMNSAPQDTEAAGASPWESSLWPGSFWLLWDIRSTSRVISYMLWIPGKVVFRPITSNLFLLWNIYMLPWGGSSAKWLAFHSAMHLWHHRN